MAKLKFEDAFRATYDALSAVQPANESFSILKAKDATLPAKPIHTNEYQLQQLIRPFFNKQGINSSQIGTPADFKHIEAQRNTIENHYIVTIFVDIKGSTRLSLLYPLEQVYQFKNAVIQTCIEIVRSLDGHVHRIMGDAVMAFFGGKYIEEENAIADAVNCSIVLRAFLENNIKPFMEDQGWDGNDIGFRIGIEYGEESQVLWSAYGYAGVSEVTATGLPVDMASKLQGQASKNQTMLGEKLLEFVNWPDEYSKIKTVQINGQNEEQKYVQPNITNEYGKPINYRMRLLDYEKSLRYSALPTDIKQGLIEGNSVVHNQYITYKCFAEINGSWQEYISASEFLDKDVNLTFEVSANTQVFRCPLRVKLTKINHGPDVPNGESGKPVSKNIKQIYANKGGRHQQSSWKSVSEPEYTSYRGLHTMQCDVFDSADNLQYRNTIAVLIK